MLVNFILSKKNPDKKHPTIVMKTETRIAITLELSNWKKGAKILDPTVKMGEKHKITNEFLPKKFKRLLTLSGRYLYTHKQSPIIRNVIVMPPSVDLSKLLSNENNKTRGKIIIGCLGKQDVKGWFNLPNAAPIRK